MRSSSIWLRTLGGRVLSLGLALAATAATAAPQPGDILIADAGVDAVFAIDPISGDRTDISSAAVGNGQVLLLAHDLMLLQSRDLLVTDSQLDALVAIDPATGDRTILSCADLTDRCTATGAPFACCTGEGSGDGSPPCAQVGTGPAFANLQRIAQASDGELFATDALAKVVFRIDPVSGDRSILSGAGSGSGVALESPIGLAIDASGSLLVVDNFVRGVFRIDAQTGDRTILSSASTGAGPDFVVPLGLAIDSLGRVFVTDLTLDAVLRVDPTTGDRVIVSSPSIGAGPPLEQPVEIFVDPAGQLLVSDTGLDAVLRIDGVSGDRSVVSGCTDTECSDLRGTGTGLLSPYGPAIFPAAEPLPALNRLLLGVAVLLSGLASARLGRTRAIPVGPPGFEPGTVRL